MWVGGLGSVVLFVRALMNSTSFPTDDLVKMKMFRDRLLNFKNITYINF